MPSKKSGEGGYCNCADCREDQHKRREYTAVAKRGRNGLVPEPIVMVGFWERVRAESALRDWDRRTRR